ncbi:MAG: putative Type IV pilus pilin [Parcubacteria bacterium C7867-005]|nr:MAG: putative Type IV pilus pilin [Parcubacteria bacterium C7867-005]
MKKNIYKKGFTLVETLVAIGILVLAVSGAFSAAQSGLSSSVFSKDQVIAFYLAAEGVEQIRNIRDNNGLADQPWLTGLTACYPNRTCTVDTVNTVSDQPVITNCAGGQNSCPNLRQDTTNGYYGYEPSWPVSNFKREITMAPVGGGGNEVSISVRVIWSKGLVTRQFNVRENIMDWQ